MRRQDVFGSVGAAQAFVRELAEVCALHPGRRHAFVIMRNHFHLALETPEPNLMEGMRRVRQHAGSPHRWIAKVLKMGSSSSVRVDLSRGN